MTQGKHNTTETLKKWYNFRLAIVAEGIVAGALAGIVVVFYRFALEKALGFAKYMYSLQLEKIWLIPIWFVLLICGGLLVGFLLKKEPMVSGSGIPQVEGILHNKLDMSWWRVMLGKLAGGIICIGAGLSLGREGPSIQIGAAAGQGFSKLFKRVRLEEKFMITCGASAGLSAAFNAPLAGAMFALEELHKNFSPIVMVSSLAASLTADFVSKEFFGMKPVFNFRQLNPIPLDKYLLLILLGILVGLLGILFNKSIFKAQDIYAALKMPQQAKPVIPFVLAGIVGLFLPEVLGGGHELINSLAVTDFSLKMLALLIAVKFLFTMASFGSSAPGGIFLPLLALGALFGALYGSLLQDVFGLNGNFAANFAILGMAGYFSAIVKAPITGCILITEMTGSFSHLLSVGLVCLVAYMTADVLNSRPIYEALLERLLNKGKWKPETGKEKKAVIETAVCMGSLLDGKRIREMDWPARCLVVGIKRGDTEFIPNGDTKIAAGDYLIILADEADAREIRECLAEAGGNCLLEGNRNRQAES